LQQRQVRTALASWPGSAPRARMLDSRPRFREGRDTSENRSLAGLSRSYGSSGKDILAGIERERLREASVMITRLANARRRKNLPRFFRGSDGGFGSHGGNKQELACSLGIGKGSRVRNLPPAVVILIPPKDGKGVRRWSCCSSYISAPGRGWKYGCWKRNRNMRATLMVMPGLTGAGIGAVSPRRDPEQVPPQVPDRRDERRRPAGGHQDETGELHQYNTGSMASVDALLNAATSLPLPAGEEDYPEPGGRFHGFPRQGRIRRNWDRLP